MGVVKRAVIPVTGYVGGDERMDKLNRNERQKGRGKPEGVGNKGERTHQSR